MAGVKALLAYVDDFRDGKVVLPEDPEYHSDWFSLGEWEDGQSTGGAVLCLPYNPKRRHRSGGIAG